MTRRKAKAKVKSGNLSLQQRENHDWGDPGPEHSHLIATVLKLRRVPIEDLTAENLRILLGQQVGVETLLPLALDLLEQDPWAEGDLYPGDLLEATRRITDLYWRDHPTEKARFDRIVSSLRK